MTAWCGVYQGVVVASADPASSGRARLQVPQVSGAAMTDWAPPAATGGSVPQVGDRVWVMYQGGDPSYPVYMPRMPVVPPVPDLELPVQTLQAAEPDYTVGAVSSGLAFTGTEWPPATFTVPASGMAKITISGSVQNVNTSTSTGWVYWAASGSFTMNNNLATGVSSIGGRAYGSRVYLLSSLTVGSLVTITPWYEFSSQSAGNTYVRDGALLVEPVSS